jgi:hypothetical protein
MVRKRNSLWLSRRTLAWPGAELLTAALIASTCPGSTAGSDASAPPRSAAGNVTTVPLEYRETPYQFLYRDLTVKHLAVRFPTEPALVSGPVVRGVLRFGLNRSNSIPFLWQSRAAKLFLDLNRNQDLTDDPAGAWSARILRAANPNFISQMFTNIPLSFPASSGGTPMRVDLRFFQQIGRPASLLCNVALRSFWQGKVTLAGQDWQVGLVQNLSEQPGSFRKGQLLLRPWEERHRGFSAVCDPVDAWPVPWETQNWVLRASDAFPFSPRVFFAGHSCELDWSAEPQGREEKLVLRLTEQQPALGELRITGSFIQRLVLAGGPYTVVLAQPAASLNVPVGQYYPLRIGLKQGRAEAYFNFGLPQSGNASVRQGKTGGYTPVLALPQSGQTIVVDDQRPAVLAVGGPLTNSVYALRQGRELKVAHRLLGAGGGEYRLGPAYLGSAGPPQFTIFKGKRKIGGGKFEFG